MDLIEVIDKILQGLDRGDVVAAMYFDLQKAFRSHYITAKIV